MKKDTLISEIPKTKTGLNIYIERMSQLISTQKNPVPEKMKDAYRQREYLLRKSVERLGALEANSADCKVCHKYYKPLVMHRCRKKSDRIRAKFIPPSLMRREINEKV